MMNRPLHTSTDPKEYWHPNFKFSAQYMSSYAEINVFHDRDNEKNTRRWENNFFI